MCQPRANSRGEPAAKCAIMCRDVPSSAIREELVAPRQEAGTLLFTHMECARVRLICTLHYELEFDKETLSVVLSLVDQLYDTRQRLLSLTAAVAAQDKKIQAAIIAAMEPNDGSSWADNS